jgi:hypothetical protein
MPPGHQPWPRLRDQICHKTVQQTPPLTIDNFMLTASAANSVVVSVNSSAAGPIRDMDEQCLCHHGMETASGKGNSSVLARAASRRSNTASAWRVTSAVALMVP